MDEGFIGVKSIDTDHLEIDTLRIGTTFLHIWDDFGLHTLYIEVVFPKSVISRCCLKRRMGSSTHSRLELLIQMTGAPIIPGKIFRILNVKVMNLTKPYCTGETPYGFFDASGSYSDFNSFSEFDSYTIGLSQIPLEGTSNFNLRGFDALRYLSPLTMPGTALRGVFADVDLMGDILGLSVSHGQEQEPQGFIYYGAKLNLIILILMPLNSPFFLKATVIDILLILPRPMVRTVQAYLTDHVYSVEGQHKFNDYLTLNAEQATDSSHDSSLASLKWQEGDFKTGLNFRNIDKNYSTISTLPAYQGETGAAWTTEGDFKIFTESTFVEAYRDRLDSNPDDPSAFNYDANGHLSANITQDLWSDSDFNYVDTPGELSPSSSLGLNERLSKSFGIWNSLKGTVFGGAGYQNSHSSDSDISDYDREDVIAGIQLPLTRQISS